LTKNQTNFLKLAQYKIHHQKLKSPVSKTETGQQKKIEFLEKEKEKSNPKIQCVVVSSDGDFKKIFT
jgi:hypothetical protein